jgi:hypothetical protein
MANLFNKMDKIINNQKAFLAETISRYKSLYSAKIDYKHN